MQLTHDAVISTIGQREVYIFSANLEGVGMLRLFERLGLRVAAFIDSRQYDNNQKRGKPVLHPDVAFDHYDKNTSFVIVATKHRQTKKSILEKLDSLDLEKNTDFLIATELCNYLPTIEVSGTCNLKCISCEAGLRDYTPLGLIDVGQYSKILAKLMYEIPFFNSVCLYMWGEPFLHPKLPDIIRLTSEAGIATDVSSNLNFGRYLEAVIKSGPDLITIPCSGYGKNYEMTHTKGSWDVFVKNIYLLRTFIDKYKVDTTVRIHYHMYKHNMQDDFDRVQDIASELGFYFFPIAANLFPGKVYDHVIENKSIPPEYFKINEMLHFPLEQQLEYAYSKRGLVCPAEKAFPNIRSDGSVSLCCNMVNTKLHDNYLEITLNDLLRLRNDSSICSKCKLHGLHRFFDVNASVDTVEGIRHVRRK